jgi:large subunit ribosomal protein L21
MLALVEIAGQQYEVKEKIKLNVPLLAGEPGDKVEFNNIFLTKNGDNINVGTPFVNGSVSATIIEHSKSKKILVFHKKRRKGYRKLNGYRSKFTQIEINDIKL